MDISFSQKGQVKWNQDSSALSATTRWFFKLSVVDQVEKGELTYKEAQLRYGIQGRSTVLVWLRKHGLQHWSPVASSPYMSPPSNSGTPKPSTPEQRIKALEVQPKDAQEKAQLFEAVLDVLGLDYGVRVVKKLWASPHAEARQRLARLQGLPSYRHEPSSVLPRTGPPRRGAPVQ